MAKIIASTLGGLLILIGLAAFTTPGMFGMHGSPLANLLNLLAGALVIYMALKAGPAGFLWTCVGVGVPYLLWGLAGVALGVPGQSTLSKTMPDLQLLVVIPGFLESGRVDNILHLGTGVVFCIAAVVAVAETPFRLRR